jgi:UPF0271 protein
VDLNADVGESFGAWTMGADAELVRLVSSANIACGFHAGDPAVMDRTVALAVAAGVAVGAHPGYRDLAGFGRREISADPDEVEREVLYQVGALAAFARAHGTALVHAKPHGALYNQAVKDERLARAIARGIARFDTSLRFVGLASSEVMRRAAEAEGLRFVAEGFADRAYHSDGTLVPRSEPGAVLTDPKAVAAQAVALARGGRIETLCLHGDTPGAIANARAVREGLAAAGIQVAPVGP